MAGARQTILDALADALIAGNIHKLRVGDLLREAGINRSTFYYHFDSLDDACTQLVNEGLTPIERYLALSPDATGETFLQELLEAEGSFFSYCKEHDGLYHALLWGDLRSRFLPAFVNRMELLLAEHYRARLATSLIEGDEIDETTFHTFLYQAVAYQQFSILETWAAQDFEQDPAYVAEIACLIIPLDSDLCSMEVRRTARSRRLA